MLGVKWQMVSYRSAGLSMQDLVAGNVDIALDAPAVVLPQFQAGTVKTYAVAAPKRVAVMPDIPTTDEAGLPGFYFSFWHAIWAPKGTPKEMIAKLNKAAVAGLADPEIHKRMVDLAKKFDAELTFDFGSVVGEVEAPHPTPMSMWREVVADTHGFATAMLDVQTKLLRPA